MRLSANIIVNYASVNQFDYPTENQWKIRAGDPNILFFQLVDLDQNGLRYMAGIGSQNQPASIVVTCPSIDNSKILQFQATQVSVADSSIWQIVILPTQIPSSGNVIFQVLEGNNARTFNLKNAMSVELPSDGSC